jgi:hypothetical protein
LGLQIRTEFRRITEFLFAAFARESFAFQMRQQMFVQLVGLIERHITLSTGIRFVIGMLVLDVIQVLVGELVANLASSSDKIQA